MQNWDVNDVKEWPSCTFDPIWIDINGHIYYKPEELETIHLVNIVRYQRSRRRELAEWMLPELQLRGIKENDLL